MSVRAAPLCAFAVNGGVYGSLLPRFPEIADRVGASEAAFGAVLFAAALGGLCGSLVAPLAVRAADEVVATVAVGSAFVLLAVGVAWAPELLALGAAFLVLGVFDGAHDVTMNALAVQVQQRLRRPIMGQMHAVWSISLTAAGILGAAAAALRVPVDVHIGTVAALAIAAQLAMFVGWRNIGGVSPADGGADAQPTSVRRPRERPQLRVLLAVLGVAAFAASYVESPGQEWTGLLLSRGFDAGAGLSAAAPVVFSAGLVASRLALDALLLRWSAGAVAASAGGMIALSMVAGLMIVMVGGSAWWALAAVGGAGLGAGVVFPLLFGGADYLSTRYGIAPAATASIISALSRVGAISAPVVVGSLTGLIGLSMVFVVMGLGGLLVLLALPRAAAGSSGRTASRRSP
ncbi:hypothetical protein ACN27F_05155 [Solwaraspora sp. WMMB335]|uniref:hypothetical protein n=1 Tax=Solwaraspora sp. WMMB335 TaxID=3404118 RepID=UPI003B92395B